MLLLAWGIFSSYIFNSMITDHDKLQIYFGPYEGRTFMNINIDNWNNWTIIAVIVTIDKFINSYSSDIIGPWITNVINDSKTREIPYSKLICTLITTFYYLYFNLKYIIMLHLIINQFDFAMLRIAADTVATIVTTNIHLKGKVVLTKLA